MMHTQDKTSMNDQRINALTTCIIAARQNKAPISLAECDLLQLNDRAEAYAVQTKLWQIRQGQSRPEAWKIGNSTDGPTPVCAPLPEIIASGESVQKSRFRRFGIEAEIAVRFELALPPRTERYTSDEILAAIGSAHVAIEIVDTALAEPEASGPLMCLADNMQHGSFVLGEAISNWRDQAWETISALSFIDKQLIAEKTAGHPHLNPFTLLPWWANEGAMAWGGVQAGDIVTTGTWNGMFFADEPNMFEVCFALPSSKALGNAQVIFGD